MQVEQQVQLPDVLSDITELALNDFIKCLSLPDEYRIDMGEWYQINGRCTICFAGAVIAQEKLVDTRRVEDLFLQLGSCNGYKMSALNSIRSGSILTALNHMSYALGTNINTLYNLTRQQYDRIHELEESYHPYFNSDDPRPFLDAMHTLITELRKIGL